jgi:hypothetical protein
MSLDYFIPELWEAKLLITKEKQLVYANLANRNYEGQIKQFGDRVRISQIGDITINDHTKNSTSANTSQFLDSADLMLDINQRKYFDFNVDDVEKVQSNVDFMNEAMRKASYRLADKADQYLAGLYTQCGITRNTSSSPVDMTSSNVENEFLMVSELMNEANAPLVGRYAIISPWVLTKINLAGIKSLTDNTAVYTNGFLGRAYGFDFYISNNVNKDSTAWADTKIVCGVKGESYTYAEQMLNIEAMRNQDIFADKIRGLFVYGGRIVQSDITACLFADKTNET